MALEELEKELYDPNPEKIKKRGGQKPPVDFSDKSEKSQKTETILSGWAKGSSSPIRDKRAEISGLAAVFAKLSPWLFWLLIIASVGIIVIGGFYFYEYSKSRDVSLSLTAPSGVLIGVPFDIEVDFSNSSDRPAQDVRLSLTLPENAISAEDRNKRIVSRALGDLAAGSSFHEKISVVIFGEDPLERFPVVISYFPPALGPKARFEKSESVDVANEGPAIKLDLHAPLKVLNNENFEIKVEYMNIAQIKFPDAQIELILPSFFNFEGATPSPSTGNNIWKIDNLDAGSSGVITVQGRVLAPEQSFEVKSSIRNDGDLIDEKTTPVIIASSPLFLNINLNNQTDYISRLDDNLRYVISYRNNSEVGLNDTVIKAKLTGEMFDFKTIATNGSFSSVDNTITWNAASIPELRVVPPGGQGTVEFDVKTRTSYPIRRLADKNFLLKIDAEISSPTVPYYVSVDRTITLAHFETRVAGQTQIQSQAFYKDPAGQIKTNGPMPPKVNTPTTFAVYWTVINYSTDVHNIEIKAVLPAGVRLTSNIKSNITTLPVYNDRTSEVTWFIDKILATKGVIGKPIEATFQIEATPNITQINQPMPLLKEAHLKAIDDFTNTTLESQSQALTTQLTNDPTVSANQYVVQP